MDRAFHEARANVACGWPGGRFDAGAEQGNRDLNWGNELWGVSWNPLTRANALHSWKASQVKRGRLHTHL
jgi:hypothetical protein